MICRFPLAACLRRRLRAALPFLILLLFAPARRRAAPLERAIFRAMARRGSLTNCAAMMLSRFSSLPVVDALHDAETATHCKESAA